MSVFNPDLFEQTVIEQANETEYTPIPAAQYVAYIKDYKVREVKRDGDDSSFVMDVFYSIQDAALKASLDQEEVIVKGNAWLDIDPSGSLAFGTNKNVQLGKLREAVLQNKSGEPWSPTMLRGAGPVSISVTVDPSTKDGKVYNRVGAVVAYSQ